MRKYYEGTLTVTMEGTGCTLCDLLKYRWSDEKRICDRTHEVLDDWKTKRGEYCPLENIRDKKWITEE